MISKHLLIMLLCCLIPVAVLAGLFFFQVQMTPTLWYSVMFLCPFLHLLMMYFMHKSSKDEHHSHSHSPSLPRKNQ
jgi:hypothetical protein